MLIILCGGHTLFWGIQLVNTHLGIFDVIVILFRRVQQSIHNLPSGNLPKLIVCYQEFMAIKMVSFPSQNGGSFRSFL